MPHLSLRNVFFVTALSTTALGLVLGAMAGCSQTFELPKGEDAGVGPTNANFDDGDGGSVFDANYDSGPKVIDYVPGVEVTTLAGSATAGTADGTGGAARFNNPVKLTFDPQGALVVSDFNNGLVRRVTTEGAVTTITTTTTLTRPFGIAFDTSGGLYVETDFNDRGDFSLQTGTLWRIESTGAATPLKADIGRPRGLLATSDGNMVLSDLANHTISIYDPRTNVLTPLAGVVGSSGFSNGAGTAARFNEPYGIARLPDGNYIVADHLNNRLRLVTPQGTVSTYAGDGIAGYIDGPRTSARFRGPKDVAVDAAGNVYVADSDNFSIRQIDTSGVVHTIAGNGNPNFADGTGAESRWYGAEGLALSPDQRSLYVADGTNGIGGYPFHRVRRIALP